MYLICCPDWKSPHKSIQDIIRSLKLVLSWQTSCQLIFKQAALFQSDSDWELVKFRFSPRVLLPFQFNVSSVSHLLKSWKQTSYDANKNDNGDEEEDEDAEDVIYDAFEGKVHAEAALMYFIATLKVGFYLPCEP